MKIKLSKTLVSIVLVFLVGSAMADDLEGRIQSVGKSNKSLVVQGIRFYTTESTDYDDGSGQKVEIDFQYRDGKHYATEIELDD